MRSIAPTVLLLLLLSPNLAAADPPKHFAHVVIIASIFNNHIYTVLLGDMVAPGVDPNHYDHYSLLRTIEDNFGIGNLGARDASAAPIVNAWNSRP